MASLACVLVWQLARGPAPEAERVRALLVGLSGRHMGRGRSFTEPAWLAGLWVYLALVNALEHYALQERKGLVDNLLRGPSALDSS